jgi:hypothetical protein
MILKGALNEEGVDDVVAEVTMSRGLVDNEAVNPLILNIWSVETSRYHAWLHRVLQGHSRHANLRKVSNQKRPST